MGYFGKYDSPAELMADDSLNTEEKIELLESWRDDKEAYMRATDEGMQGPSRAEALRQIENALLALREDGRGGRSGGGG